MLSDTGRMARFWRSSRLLYWDLIDPEACFHYTPPSRLRDPPEASGMPSKKWLRSGVAWILVLIAVCVMWYAYANSRSEPDRVDFNTSVVQDIRDGDVEQITAQEGSSEVRI